MEKRVIKGKDEQITDGSVDHRVSKSNPVTALKKSTTYTAESQTNLVNARRFTANYEA